jgi:hypothetical protein
MDMGTDVMRTSFDDLESLALPTTLEPPVIIQVLRSGQDTSHGSRYHGVFHRPGPTGLRIHSCLSKASSGQKNALQGIMARHIRKVFADGHSVEKIGMADATFQELPLPHGKSRMPDANCKSAYEMHGYWPERLPALAVVRKYYARSPTKFIVGCGCQRELAVMLRQVQG